MRRPRPLLAALLALAPLLAGCATPASPASPSDAAACPVGGAPATLPAPSEGRVPTDLWIDNDAAETVSLQVFVNEAGEPDPFGRNDTQPSPANRSGPPLLQQRVVIPAGGCWLTTVYAPSPALQVRILDTGGRLFTDWSTPVVGPRGEAVVSLAEGTNGSLGILTRGYTLCREDASEGCRRR